MHDDTKQKTSFHTTWGPSINKKIGQSREIFIPEKSVKKHHFFMANTVRRCTHVLTKVSIN